ncbi:MAG: MerC domain-containing protein [Pseudomonadota bacterium]
MPSKLAAFQPLADRAAIGVSLLCALHCLAIPVAAVMMPAVLATGIASESFHAWLVLLVVPLSAFALTLGCRKHRNTQVFWVGVLGLLCLCLTPILGHDLLGEWGERALTLVGASLVALSHVKNFQLCQRQPDC